MPARPSFEYAVVRVVPRVEREEFINAGVILFGRAQDFLRVRIELDERRLAALAPSADLELIHRHLDAITRVCAGGRDAGPIAELPVVERWRWLVAPRNTILQTSPPHVGIGDDLDVALERIVADCVRMPSSRR